MSSLELRLPRSSSTDTTSTARVLDFELDAGDIRLTAIPPTEAGPWNVRLPTPSTEVTLSYRLVGVTTRRAAASPRRALLQVRPLAYAAGPAGGYVVVEIRDVVVHNVVCPDLPLRDQLCGREDNGRWRTTEIPARQSTVMVQIDLPLS